MTIDLIPTAGHEDAAGQRAPHDQPASLPPPRGPLTSSLLNYLLRNPARTRVNPARLTWSGTTTEATTDHDLQLALWLAYELHYRGLAGVDDAWEWHPGLVEVIREWEALMLDALAGVTGGPTVGGEPGAVAARLFELAAADGRPSLSQALMRDATVDQFRELLVHRTMAAIQADGYGSGGTGAMHARLFRSLLADWGLETRHGHYLGCLPGVTLLISNLISMFGLNRRFRGALMGHLAIFEMTSSMLNAQYAGGHRRLDGSAGATRFFDEDVVADAAHEQVAAYDLAKGLAAAEPRLSDDILFGARCAAYAEEQFAAFVLSRWAAGQSSLLRAIDK